MTRADKPLTDLQYLTLRAARDGVLYMSRTRFGVRFTIVVDRRDPRHDVTTQVRALRLRRLVRWLVVRENDVDLGCVAATDAGMDLLDEEKKRRMTHQMEKTA